MPGAPTPGADHTHTRVVHPAPGAPVPTGSEPPRPPEDARRRERELHGYMAGSEWVPPLPLGRRVEPWVRGLPMEVVGEAYHYVRDH